MAKTDVDDEFVIIRKHTKMQAVIIEVIT